MRWKTSSKLFDPRFGDIQPTNKSFHVDFCTVALWKEQGQIMEENLFYDLMGMLKQIGVMPAQAQKAA